MSARLSDSRTFYKYESVKCMNKNAKAQRDRRILSSRTLRIPPAFFSVFSAVKSLRRTTTTTVYFFTIPENCKCKKAQRSFRFTPSLRGRKFIITTIFLFWFFFLFVNDVNLWTTLTLTEAIYAEP
jgi:hypothetical protein